MKRVVSSLLATIVVVASVSAQGPIFINEVHGFGNGSTPAMAGDYIELRNTSPTAINLGGWTLGIWVGNTGTLTQKVLLPSMFIEGNCHLILQEFGVLGGPLSLVGGLPANTRGYQMGTSPLSSSSSVGIFLKDPAGVNSDYVYLYRGATTGLPTAPPHLATAGTGAAWTIGAVATSGTGMGLMQRTTDADLNSVANWTQHATANQGSPSIENAILGATQSNLGPCSGLNNFDLCGIGQPNTPMGTMTIQGVLAPNSPSSVTIYPDNEPLSISVTSNTAGAGAPVLMAVSPNCNVGHFVDPNGLKLDLGASFNNFCDVDFFSFSGVGNLCLGTPILPLGALNAIDEFNLNVNIGPTYFGPLGFQALIVDATTATGLRPTGATFITTKPGHRFAGGTNLPLAIPDGIGSPGAGPSVITEITVGAAGPIVADLDVLIRITHTWYGDPNIVIEHVPTATVVALLTFQTPDDSSDLVGLYHLTDQAAGTLDAAAVAAVAEIPPGMYRPDGLLSTFNGLSSVGTWRITAFDIFAADVGTIQDWSLIINGAD